MKTVFKFKNTNQMLESLNKKFKPFSDHVHVDSFAEIFKSNTNGTIHIDCTPKFPHHFRYRKCVFSITIDVLRCEYRISTISRFNISSDGSVCERYGWIP